MNSWYAKIVDGEVQWAPYEIYDENGRVIERNVNRVLEERGYKVVIASKPYYDANTQDLYYKGFIEENIRIILQYEVINK